MIEQYGLWRKRLAEAMDPRFYTIDYLDWLVAERRAQLWFGERSAALTELKLYPTGTRAIGFLVAAGDKTELVDVIRPQIEEWGQSQGCIASLIESRPGWERELKRHGYSLFQASIMKEL